MLRYLGALALAMAAVSPAQAATTVTLVPANTTFATAPIIQSFSTGLPNNSAFRINTTNTSPIPNSPAGVESIDGTVTTSNAMRAGTTDDYLVLGNQASYTINFSAKPLSFFSFAFNVLGNNNTLTLFYDNATSQQFQSNANGPGNNFGLIGMTLPASGRLIYDTSLGPQITSAVFFRNGANNVFVIDDIAVAAPEPATWLMMILGFGVVGSQLRRRRAKAKGKFATA